jgi:hypothetical protein
MRAGHARAMAAAILKVVETVRGIGGSSAA